MHTIAELLGQHSGCEAWIFGKGPSLDAFDMNAAGPLRICINESALVVPAASYFFAHDEVPIKRVAARWPIGCHAILQPVRAAYAATCGIPADAIFAYEKIEGRLEILDWSADQIAQNPALIGLTGTVHSALHFCRLIGASSVAFVGMDGGPAYARCIGLPPPPGGGRHDLIRHDSIRIAERIGIPVRFLS